MWPVMVEYLLSVGWSYAMLAVALLWLAGFFIELPPQYRVPTLLSGWSGVVLGTTCLLQIAVSLALDSRYDKGTLRHFFWMIWYPLAYWTFNMAATVTAVPRALARRFKKRARWVSPDRGIHV
jgi:biofilm PGA synthesis N-glycosyltransferase PgaC